MKNNKLKNLRDFCKREQRDKSRISLGEIGYEFNFLKDDTLKEWVNVWKQSLASGKAQNGKP